MAGIGGDGLPRIIQGGMGIGISDWRLARAVAAAGQLGVVSGTAVDTLLVRRLQDGDRDGSVRRAIARFPFEEVGAATLERFFLADGRAPGTPYVQLPLYKQVVSRARAQLTMLAAFVEVQLAREGHDGEIGMNLLTKVQMPNLATLYGAMLAGVDYVIMGAGIPREIPAALDRLAVHEPAVLRFEIEGAAGPAIDGQPPGPDQLTFDPAEHLHGRLPPELVRPRFLPVISSSTLASLLARKATGRIDGFIIEGPTAGGHNAPPRERGRENARGEPVYGPRDAVDLDVLREIGLPFWLAGGMGSPEALCAALRAGAAGVQVGTLFAFCDDSGLASRYRIQTLAAARLGLVDVRTDPNASPTGFPFKVVELPDSLAEDRVYAGRERVCDLGYLRTAYRRPGGRIGYRCPAEPVETFVAKGGDARQTLGRKCLCNALMANIGRAQSRADGRLEPPLLTSGDDLRTIGSFLAGRSGYTARDVIQYLLAGSGSAVAAAGCVATAAVPSARPPAPRPSHPIAR